MRLLPAGAAYVLTMMKTPSITSRTPQAYLSPLTTNISTMKTFQIVTLFAMIAASMAFAPNAPKGEYFYACFSKEKWRKSAVHKIVIGTADWFWIFPITCMKAMREFSTSAIDI